MIGLVGLGFETQVPLGLGRARSRFSASVAPFLTLRLLFLATAALALAIVAMATEPGATRTAMLIALPALLGRGVSLFTRWVFIGMERTEYVFRISLLLRVFEVLVGMCLLAFGAGILTLLALHAVAWVADGMISVWILRGHHGRIGLKSDRRLIKVILRRGVPLGLGGALRQWLTSGPIVLLKILSGDLALVGQFALAQQIAILAASSAQSFYQAALPVLSRASRRRDAIIAGFGLKTSFVSLLIFGGAAVVAVWVGPPLTASIFGPEFEMTGVLLAPFMLIAGLIVAPTGFVQTLATRAVLWPEAAANAVGALVVIAAFTVFVPGWGIWAAIWGIAAAWTVRALVVIVLYLLTTTTQSSTPPSAR